MSTSGTAAAILTADEKATLLALAREALAAHLEDQPWAGPGERGRTLRLEAPGAAFVTLRSASGDLRGCLGTTRFERPLREVVPELAVSAATSDRRFDPIDPSEGDVRISISILSPLEPARTDAIEIGKHGLVVRRGGSSGLLLPQVASERGWDAATFLAETSRKAGLAHDAWRQPDATVLWFTAESFAER